MTRFTRLVAAVLCFLLCAVSLGACTTDTPTPPDNDTTPSMSSADSEPAAPTTTTDPEEATLKQPTINGISLSAFTITIPAGATQLEKYAASLLRDAIAARTGLQLKTQTQSDTAGRHSIILQTTADDTEAPAAYSYSIYYNDGNLYIRGGAHALIAGIDSFISEQLSAVEGDLLALELPESPVEASVKVSYPADASLDGKQLVALCDQKNASLVMIDLSAADPTSDDAIVWSWKPSSTLGYDSMSSYGNRIDEAILRYSEFYKSYVIGVTSSSGYMCLVEYPSGKCLWEASAPGYGPHSIECLPDGNVAVACSGNGDNQKACVRLYASTNGKHSTTRASKLIAGAHGILWDDDYRLLWVLGSTTLCAFRIGYDSGKPTLTEVPQLCLHTGITGGHNLSVCAADPDLLWITGSRVWTFRKSTGVLSSDIPAGSLIAQSTVKSMDSFEDGTIIQAVATNVYAAHNTDTLLVYRPGENGSYLRLEYRFPDRAFYKARRVSAKYT